MAPAAEAQLVSHPRTVIRTRADAPKLLADPAARVRRRRDLQRPHMRALVRFVKSLRRRVGQGAKVPDFDSWDGGVRAECLFLLEAPGGKAVESGFISRDNPDETARNFLVLNQAAGLARERTVTWNVVPWYVGTGSKIRPVKQADIASAAPYLAELVDILPSLRVAVLIGRKAQRAEAHFRALVPRLLLLTCPHPSPLFVNNRPGNSDKILAVLKEAAAFLDSEVRPRPGGG